MLGDQKLRVVIIVLWICSFYGKEEVEAFINDGLNPVKVHLDVWHQRPPRVASRVDENLGCERQHVYTCEEPADTVPPEAPKTCTFRNQRYHEQVYRWVAGRGCLLYTPDFLFVGGVNTINLNAGCFYGNWFAPCLEIAKEDGTCGCYPFDPGLEAVAKAVRENLLPAAQTRWEHCFYAARQCCSHFMGEDDNLTEATHCEATFDGWTCWAPAEAGILATEACSEFAFSGQGPSCDHFSSKQCYENGTWDIQTDYSSCSIIPRLLRRYRFYIVVLSFSIASCLPAVFMFFFYKRLRITAVALHRNLLIAIIVRNVLVIVSRAEVYIDELTNTEDTVMTSHGVGCRVLAVAERLAGNAVFVCMLVEGVYLHRMIVTVFRRPNICLVWLYVIGAVLAIAPVATWSVMMSVYDDHSCWLVNTMEHVQWVIDGPRVAMLLVNTALFIDILRVLLTSASNSEKDRHLSTAKATLILMPVFGSQFLLTAFQPATSDCTTEQIYYYVAYTFEGLQGFIVAMLYCYINRQVHTLIKSTHKKTENLAISRAQRDTYRSSYEGDRMPYDTGLQNPNDVKDQYSTINRKLHVAEIISIHASERLAEILDPEYETINNGTHNEGYDSLERSETDNGSAFTTNGREDYYGFTNASSISIKCQDWIRCISTPSSSVCEHSFNEFEVISSSTYPYQNHRVSEIQTKSLVLEHEYNNMVISGTGQEQLHNITRDTEVSEYEDCDENNMLEEIMQYIESTNSNSRCNSDSNNNATVALD